MSVDAEGLEGVLGIIQYTTQDSHCLRQLLAGREKELMSARPEEVRTGVQPCRKARHACAGVRLARSCLCQPRHERLTHVDDGANVEVVLTVEAAARTSTFFAACWH